MRTFTHQFDENTAKYKISGSISRSMTFHRSSETDQTYSVENILSMSMPVVGDFDHPYQERSVYSNYLSKVISFYNVSGLLCYSVSTRKQLHQTNTNILGLPGIAYHTTGGSIGWYSNETSSSRLVYVNVYGDLVLASVNQDNIESGSSSIFHTTTTISASYTSKCAVHCPSYDEIVVFDYDDGGIQIDIWYNTGSWTKYSCPYRIMYPTQTPFRNIETRPENLTLFTAVRYGTSTEWGDNYRTVCYISNPITGGVDGVSVTTDNCWSDIFVAIPSDIDADMSEVRIINAFWAKGIASSESESTEPMNYIVASYRNNMLDTNDVEMTQDGTGIEDTNDPYTIICMSRDGLTYSMNRFSLVSDDPYRYQVLLDEVGKRLVFVNTNAAAYEDAHYVFLGDTRGNTGYVNTNATELTDNDLLSYSDKSQQSASLRLATGNDWFNADENLDRPNSKVIINLGMTNDGNEASILYGTYIIETISEVFADGKRQLDLQLTNQTAWMLSRTTFPYYTEILGKEAVAINEIDHSYLYAAPKSGLYETRASIDFWGAEGYENSEEGITPISILNNGGVGCTELTGSHKAGIKSADILAKLKLANYPRTIDTQVTLHVYGWSSNRVGSTNDTVSAILFLKDKDEVTSTVISTNTGHFPNTYGTTAGGSLPIVIDIEVPEDVYITNVGLIFENSSTTYIVPARVDITQGIVVQATSAIPWTADKENGFTLPGSDYPYIMFSRVPYNAYGFKVSAIFEHTLANLVPDARAYYGLVGLAQNGENYMCARYSITENEFQLIKVRNGLEEKLAEATPSITMTGEVEVMFTHLNGKFEIYAKNTYDIWESQLTYTWTEDDGYLYPDIDTPCHCGIYGFIDSPKFRITGHDIGGDETISNAPAIALHPQGNIDELYRFPSSGMAMIDNNLYRYTWRLLGPKPIQGPYQFRNSSDGTTGMYGGIPGLECLYLHWTNSSSYYTNYLVAIDDGATFPITTSNWQPQTIENGSLVDLPNRSRHFVSTSYPTIGTNYHGLDNKVYITSGLTGVTLYEGDSTRHSELSWCRSYYTGSIYCKQFKAFNHEPVQTVESLIKRIVSYCNSVVTFEGNTNYATFEEMDDMPNVSNIGTLRNTKSIDLKFTQEITTNGDYVDIYVNANIRDQDNEGIVLRIQRVDSTNYIFGLYAGTFSAGISLIEAYPVTIPSCDAGINREHELHILFHNNFVSCWLNGLWIYTFAQSSLKNEDDPLNDTPGIEYQPYTYIWLRRSSATNVIVTDIELSELCDVRNAVYIDLETTAISALSSIIQQRPIEIIYKSDGSIAMFYEKIRDNATLSVPVRQVTHRKMYPEESGSDATIYGYDISYIRGPKKYREFYGLSHRVMRLPDLENGEARAARHLLERAMQRSEMYEITCLPHLHIEPQDRLILNVNIPGTGTQILTLLQDSDIVYPPSNQESTSLTVTGNNIIRELIVEQVNITMDASSPKTMTIVCRAERV